MLGHYLNNFCHYRYSLFSNPIGFQLCTYKYIIIGKNIKIIETYCYAMKL